MHVRLRRACLGAVALPLALLWAQPVHAQGNDGTTTADQGSASDRGGEVQIGAGSTAATTTGSSGSTSSSNPGLQGLPAPFDLIPPQHRFRGPEPLAIQAPRELRCDLIDNRTAKARCAAQGRSWGVGVRG